MFEIVIGVAWIISLTSIVLGYGVLDYMSKLHGLDIQSYELSKRKKNDKREEAKERALANKN